MYIFLIPDLKRPSFNCLIHFYKRNSLGQWAEVRVFQHRIWRLYQTVIFLVVFPPLCWYIWPHPDRWGSVVWLGHVPRICICICRCVVWFGLLLLSYLVFVFVLLLPYLGFFDTSLKIWHRHCHCTFRLISINNVLVKFTYLSIYCLFSKKATEIHIVDYPELESEFIGASLDQTVGSCTPDRAYTWTPSTTSRVKK